MRIDRVSRIADDSISISRTIALLFYTFFRLKEDKFDGELRT